MNEGLVVVVRAIISFFTLLILARLLGKEQISQLTFFDYILGITIGSIASEATVDLSSRAWPHFIGLVSWAVLAYLMQYISLKWRYAAKLIEGEPVIVIMNGKILDNVLKKMKFRVSDVLELLRNQGIFDMNEVDYAILEPNGSLSVLKKPEYLPVTRQDLKIKAKPTGISTELVYDGKLIKQNLRQMNKDEKWLMNQLKKHGINDVSEAFLVLINDAGSLYVDKYDDDIKNVKDIGDYKGPY
ncbi:MAG: DUF421 domain-containing protein [Clostridiales bacterium]|nr:DUF421 domain-containing protein [Clostridiales bacterium]